MKTNIQLQSWLRRAAVLLITLAGSLPIMAQQEEIEGGEAFYIYQNDGHFDGFFYDQVKQIRFSRLDTLGIEHDQYVSQEIVTEDSIYRIMLTAIDSVSLVQPEIKFAKEVRFMRDEGMMAYYQSISKPNEDSFLLRFSGSMPAYLQPKVGDVLSCPNLKDYDEAFVGKVKKISANSGEILVECGYIEDLSEVFEQFVTVEQIRQVKTDEGYQARRRMAGLHPTKRAEGNWEDITLFNFSKHVEGSIGVDRAKVILGADIGLAAVATAIYKISGWRDFYIKTEVKPHIGLNLNASIDGQIGGEWSLTAIPGFGDLLNNFTRIPFPAVCPILYINVTPEPFIRAEAHLNFALNTGAIAKGLGLGLELKSEAPYIVPTAGLLTALVIPEAAFLPTQLDPKFSFSAELNGMAQIGLKSPIDIGTMDWLKWVAAANTKATLYAGPKLDGKFPLSLDMLDITKVFENMKEAEVNLTTMSYDLEFVSKGKIFGWDKEIKKSYNFSLLKYPMKAFPEIDITNMKFDLYGEKKNNIKVSYSTKGDVFIPQRLGIGIYKPADKDDKEFKTLYKSDFRYETYLINTFNTVELSFENLEAGEYVICPIIKPIVPLIPTDKDGLIPAYKGKYKFKIAPQDLVLNPSEIQAEEEGGEFSIEVLTGFETPIILDIPESSAKWIKAVLVPGSNNAQTLKITVDENQTDVFRTGMIYVRQEISASEVVEKTLTVKQYGGLELSKSKLEFESGGGEETIDILTSYKPITINLNDGLEWLNYSLDDRKLTIKANTNEGGNRTATVFINAWNSKKGQNVETKLYVTQKGLVDASIDPTELYFEKEGGTQRVYVAVGNNTQFADVSVRDKSAQWITIEKMSSLFNVTVSPNEDEERTTYIDVTFTTQKDGKTFTATIPVAITQKGVVHASISPSELSYGSDGGSQDVGITKGPYKYCKAKVDNDAKDWLSISLNDAGENVVLKVTTTKNTSKVKRTGIITVYLSDTPDAKEEDMAQATVTVTQVAEFNLELYGVYIDFENLYLDRTWYNSDGTIQKVDEQQGSSSFNLNLTHGHSFYEGEKLEVTHVGKGLHIELIKRTKNNSEVYTTVSFDIDNIEDITKSTITNFTGYYFNKQRTEEIKVESIPLNLSKTTIYDEEWSGTAWYLDYQAFANQLNMSYSQTTWRNYDAGSKSMYSTIHVKDDTTLGIKLEFFPKED